MADNTRPRPCPYCKHKINYPDSYNSADDKNYCPNCEKQIVYSLQIYPGNKWLWSKPYNPNKE